MCRGPRRGREAAPRVGEDGLVRAGVPGSETYGKWWISVEVGGEMKETDDVD